MTLTFPLFNFSNLTRLLGQPFRTQTSPGSGQKSENDAALADRAFLHEIMCRNPEAVQSDIGLAAMMCQYPTKF